MDTDSVSSEYKVSPPRPSPTMSALKVAVARLDNSRGDLSGQTVIP